MSEMFLAEAAVAVVPDLTAFRVKLIRDLQVATSGVVANVKVAAQGATTAAAAATTAGRGASQSAVAGRSVANASIRAQEEALRKLAAAESAIQLAEKRTLATTSAAAAARVRLTAATRAVTLTEQGLAAAQRSQIVGAIDVARASNIAALAHEQQALAAFNATQAEKGLAAQQAVTAARSTAIGKGLATQSLAAAGLRGAVLSANPAFIAGTVAAVAFAKSVGAAANLESELNVFAVTAGATAEQMARVAEEAKALGADITLPGVGASDAAEAFTELAKAGLSVGDSLAGARGVLQLATAAQIDNAQATELAANALNSFGLAGSDAVHVADVLANAANDSQGSIVDMGTALQQASSVGRQAGLSLEQTTAALTLFARAGIRGSDAGTSFRTAIIRLINPTDKAQAVIDELGLHTRDALGNINLGVFDEFARKTKDLTAAQRDQSLAIIFGQDAIRGAAILAREGSAGLQSQIDSLNKQGTAAEVAAARMAGLTGALENLKNSLSTAGVAIGSALIPALTATTNVITKIIGSINALDEKLADLRESAQKPFEFLPGGGGNAADLVRDVNENFREMSANMAVLKANSALPDLIEDLNKTGASSSKLNEVVVRLKEMEKGMVGGSEQAEKFRQNFANFILQLQELSTQPDIEIPIKLPRDLLTGTVVSGAGNKAAVDWGLGFLPSFEDTLKDASARFKQAFADSAALAGRQAAAALDAALDAASGQAAGFSRAQTRARGEGDQQAELDALEGFATRQQRIIDRINGATGGDPKDAALARRTGAEEALAGARERIRSINDGIIADAKEASDKRIADAKEAATKLRTAREKADRRVVDDISDRSAAFDTRKIAVDATPGLADDITLARNRKRFLKRQIEIAQKSIKDDELRSDTIRDLRDQRKKLTVEIEGLLVEQAEAAVVKATGRFDASLNLAQALGNIPLQIKLIDRRIAEINKLVEARKKESGALKLAGKARDDALAEAANLATQREGLEDQRIQEGIGLGQSILDLTKNKNPLLKALNRAAAETRKDIAAAKKAGRSTVVLQTELNNFLQQRKEVLKTVDDEKRGPTAFDLLSQFSGIFGETAGNLIGGSQPFQTAGGINGFTADIAAHLRRTGAGGKTLGGLAGKTKAERNILKLDDTAIVTAMNGLKDAFLGRSGPGTGEVPRRQSPGSGAVERNDNRWREAGRARSAVEQRRSGI